MGKVWKVLSVVAIVATVIACGPSGNDHDGTDKAAKGGVYYGGVFRMNEVEDFKSLYPPNITEVVGHRIGNQLYEGLVKLDQEDLSVQPCIAEKWEVNEDATQFTFFIRKGIKFHDNDCFDGGKGRELVASDVKYCLDKLCEVFPENQMYWLFKDKVVGANAYHDASKDGNPMPGGVSGIKVIDDYTLQIDLEYPFGLFLKILSHSACWIYPKEAFDKYGIDMRKEGVGTGPFRVKNIKEGEAAILENNPDYWGIDQYGNQLPYLQGIRFSFIKEKKTELLEFKKGNLDMIFRLPLEMIDEIAGELSAAKAGEIPPFEMQVVPAMSVFYYGFQHKSEIFSNKDVRKAFNYAIDRESIVTYTLQGEGRPGIHGIVPPFKGYQYDQINGFEYNPEMARDAMAAAGYPNGKGFPKITLRINSGGGDRNVHTAEVIQKMLNENLNIDIDIEILQWAQHLDAYETGKSTFWRTGWIADYPDPENFLNLLYGSHVPENLNDRSFINSVRYQSTKFDSIFKLALREPDEKKRYDLFRQADQVAIDDAAVMPIFYDENTRLIQVGVRNFPANAMEYRDLTEVYFEPAEDEVPK